MERSAQPGPLSASPTSTQPRQVLAINGGSSSIKFALYRVGDPLRCTLTGQVSRIGVAGTSLSHRDLDRNRQGTELLDAADYAAATRTLVDWLEEQVGLDSISAVGHRVVHGMKFVQPEPVTAEVIAELHHIAPFDPEHLPGEIALIEEFARRRPRLAQLACFDTAFHRTMPRVASLLPLPRRYDAMGIQRYGFHGLSYAFLSEELARVAGAQAARGRVIMAHLGNGASLAALADGKSVDTSMGFTPTGGVPMSTRAGELDPGVIWYLLESEKLSPQQFSHLMNDQCGLLGVSETSSDMRDLLEREADDVRAAEAVAMFCYHVKKCIGAYAAVLGGVDTLVFAGGVGENSAVVRARICQGLEFLGIAIDDTRNASNEGVISQPEARATVRVIRTDEQSMIARSVCRAFGLAT